MFSSMFDCIKEAFSVIVNPIYSYSIDGVTIYQWAFVVFLGCCLVRFVLPLLGLDGTGLTVRRAFGDSPDPKVSTMSSRSSRPRTGVRE